ncbi:glycosyltransferase [Rheinheimera fenheensis]|uniref:glycosyltransferase n=1 Tax=Rheinheimera fenheensis TaxID=3152295 RepID=UPI00325FF7B9
MFSVLMSVYARENPHWLRQSLSSILADQTVKPAQVVLVADGPLHDELEQVIADFKQYYGEILDICRLDSNRGLGYALNEGLLHCKFDWIARMDADDIALPQRFSRQLDFIKQNPEVDIVGSYAEDMDAGGASISIRKVPVGAAQIHQLMWTCPLIHPSVMYRKSVVLSAGSYSKTLKRRQDYDLWFRCARAGAGFANIAEPLIRYRITDQTYARNNVSVAWNQAIIGFKGCRALSLGLKAHLGVFYPVIKAILPLKLRKGLEGIIKKFDPRGNH